MSERENGLSWRHVEEEEEDEKAWRWRENGRRTEKT